MSEIPVASPAAPVAVPSPEALVEQAAAALKAEVSAKVASVFHSAVAWSGWIVAGAVAVYHVLH